MAGARSAALAYANANVAGAIGGLRLGAIGSGIAHGARGAAFARLGGADVKSGIIGGMTEGMIGTRIKGWTDGERGSGAVLAGLVSGTVSEATGGKFMVGAATGAMGYLFNQMSQESADPNGEPFVENEYLNRAARDILAPEGSYRMLDKDGRLIYSLPQDWEAYTLPEGGGFVIARPGWRPMHGLQNVVRVQPPGTGSFKHNPKGYYVVYNKNGQPISPYSGRTVSRKKWHNEFSIIIPGRYGE